MTTPLQDAAASYAAPFKESDTNGWAFMVTSEAFKAGAAYMQARVMEMLRSADNLGWRDKNAHDWADYLEEKLKEKGDV
jgi:hypothetical protein